MKFASARIVTEDVTALASFYERITGVAPVGNEDCRGPNGGRGPCDL